MMASTQVRTSHRTAVQDDVRAAVMKEGVLPYVLSGDLAVVAACSGALGLFYPSLLEGSAVSRGNLQGTALVVMAIGVPLSVGAMVGAARGSARALVLWLGTTAYLLYQGVLFCFATPMNSVFLLYVAHLGLGIWTLVAVLSHIECDGLAARIDAGMPLRAIAGITGTLAALNALVWLARIVPGIGISKPGSVLEGSGLVTSPVWVQDLAFWIPLTIVMAVLMWRGRLWGTLLTGAMLVVYVIECLSIASDQWWGARADASHPDLASMAAVPPFVVAAVLLVLPLLWYLRHVDSPTEAGSGLVQ